MKQKHRNTATTAIRKYGWLPLVAFAAVLAACTADNDTLPADGSSDTPVAFTASLPVALPQAEADDAKTPATRTATGADGNTVWTPGDAVGIFMLTTQTYNPDGILPGGENARYTVDPATGKLTADGAPMHYPREGAVDFRAYYPHGTIGTGNITDNYTYRISVTDQSDPASLDLLRAEALKVKNPTSKVSLNFQHVLAKIKLDITLGEGLSGLDASKITAATITGMPTTAKFVLLSSLLIQPDNPADIAALQKPTPSPGADATFTALVVPHAAPIETGSFSDRHIVVTVDGVEYTGDIPHVDGFFSDCLSTYPVTVQKSGITIGKATFAKWETNEHGQGEAEIIPTI